MLSSRSRQVPHQEGHGHCEGPAIWPLWKLFDLTPEGRGTDWYPKLSYD